MKRYGECHKPDLNRFSKSFYGGAMALISCKNKNNIQMQGCDAPNGNLIGTVDTMKNGKCTWMYKDEMEFGLIIDAVETTPGEALGAVFGVLVGVCCCVAIAAFVWKKMGAKAGEALGEHDVEMSKPDASEPPPPSQPPQMGQPQQMMPQQQMYGQQPGMMQQPMGM